MCTFAKPKIDSGQRDGVTARIYKIKMTNHVYLKGKKAVLCLPFINVV